MSLLVPDAGDKAHSPLNLLQHVYIQKFAFYSFKYSEMVEDSFYHYQIQQTYNTIILLLQLFSTS